MKKQFSYFLCPLLFIVIMMNANCTEKNNFIIKIVDSVSNEPIEGSLVYIKDYRHALRSNIDGEVFVSDDYLPSIIEVTSKNYQPLNISSNQLNGTVIQLVFDSSRVNPEEAKMVFTKADTLRGSYGPYRQNNDILFYDLVIKVSITEKYINGYNEIQFKMIDDGDQIQIDLFENMQIDSIMKGNQKLNYNREFNAVFIQFQQPLLKNSIHEIKFYYSGNPVETGRFGGFTFSEDSLGNPWVFTACQGIGASLWWPNKDQQPDEPDSMNISISVPSYLMNISNGKLVNQHDLGNGYTKFNWQVRSPINNYSVSLNTGKYVHFSEPYKDSNINYYVMPYHLEQAKQQFKQTIPMLECFENYVGEYPFPDDGYKLVEVPYSGMEHQSAITYGNMFKNGYLDRDWTGVGISTKFDFIIVHESAHEWFGNSVSCNDFSDAWIHEGWGTYLEAIYVECLWGYSDAIKYLNGYKDKIYNTEPIIGPTAVNHWPTGDMYFKGALFINTIRSIINDDNKWWNFVRDYYNEFSYQNIFTTDVLNYFNEYFDQDFKPIFEQYLYFADIPILQLRRDGEVIFYRWKTNIDNFDMPILVGINNDQHFIYPKQEWKSEKISFDSLKDWHIDTDKFYVEIDLLDS